MFQILDKGPLLPCHIWCDITMLVFDHSCQRLSTHRNMGRLFHTKNCALVQWYHRFPAIPGPSPISANFLVISELLFRKVCEQWYFENKNALSCRFYLKPIHWLGCGKLREIYEGRTFAKIKPRTSIWSSVLLDLQFLHAADTCHNVWQKQSTYYEYVQHRTAISWKITQPPFVIRNQLLPVASGMVKLDFCMGREVPNYHNLQVRNPAMWSPPPDSQVGL